MKREAQRPALPCGAPMQHPEPRMAIRGFPARPRYHLAVIQFQNICKSFGPVRALDNVSFEVPDKRILGLLGENGAGKSTLIHILFGLLRPDSGRIFIDGAARKISSPRKAQALAIGMVHQHFRLVPTFTALQNFRLFLPLRPRRLAELAGGWREKLRWDIPLDARIENLSVGQQQRVEILKALLTLDHAEAKDKSIGPTLILDEPTAVLTPQESEELFSAMAALKSAGTTVVFISHKLAEVRAICEEVAILRKGRLVYTGALAGISQEALAEKMIGAPIHMPHLDRSAGAAPRAPNGQAAALEIENLSTTRLRNVSLAVHPGEILGIAGVDGNGQSHLVQAILGTLPPPGISAGNLVLQGKNAGHLSTRERLERIAFIAEDRHREALVLPLSLTENLMLKDYHQGRFNTLGFLRFGAMRRRAKEILAQFDVRHHALSDPAGRLSGGNQQKLVLGRELSALEKPILLAVNPTRGLDIGATAFVLQKLLDARKQSKAILLIHSDLDELLAVSDRIAVIYNGTLTPTAWPETTKEKIGQLMLGLTEPAA